MDRRTLPTKLTMRRVQIFETDRAALSSIAWDTFAAKCGASFRCAHGALAAWQLSNSMFFRLRLFEIYGGEFGGKIGQCAVAVSRKQSYFIDGIQLSPGDEALWEASMTAVLGRLGPGRYRYGSPWSIEKAREQGLQLLRNVSVEVVESHVVQGVDFNRWKSWDDYIGAVSNNARRNAKKARIRFPALQIRVNRGLVDTSPCAGNHQPAFPHEWPQSVQNATRSHSCAVYGPIIGHGKIRNDRDRNDRRCRLGRNLRSPVRTALVLSDRWVRGG